MPPVWHAVRIMPSQYDCANTHLPYLKQYVRCGRPRDQTIIAPQLGSSVLRSGLRQKKLKMSEKWRHFLTVWCCACEAGRAGYNLG